MRMQIKRWAASTPGWFITSLFMTASKFDSAPTGSSTIMRFLKPKGGPESTAHGPDLPAAAGYVGEASAAPGVSGVSAAARAHDSTAAAYTDSLEAAHSLSGNQAFDPAEVVEATAHASWEGVPLPEHRGTASIWQGSSSRQLGGSACQGVEDAGSRTLQPLHSMSMAFRHERQQLAEASRVDPADQLPGSSQHAQETMKQVPEQTRSAEIVHGSCAAVEVLHGSGCLAAGDDLAASAHAGKATVVLQHKHASQDCQTGHSNAADGHSRQGVSRKWPGSELPDSRMAGRDVDEASRSCQDAGGIIEGQTEKAQESRRQSACEGEHEREPSNPGRLSHNVCTFKNHAAITVRMMHVTLHRIQVLHLMRLSGCQRKGNAGCS